MPMLQRLSYDQLLKVYLELRAPPTKQELASLCEDPGTAGLLDELRKFLDADNCHGVIVYENPLLDSSTRGWRSYVGFGDPPTLTCKTAAEVLAKYPVVSVDGRDLLASNRGHPRQVFRKESAADYPDNPDDDSEYVESPNDYVRWSCPICSRAKSAMIAEVTRNGPPSCDVCVGDEVDGIEMVRE